MKSPKTRAAAAATVAAVAPAGRTETTGPAVRVASTDTAIGAAAAATGAPVVSGEALAPTGDPASPDLITDRPVVVDGVVERTPAVALERPNTDIGAFRQGHEGVSGSIDGEHGRGTLVDGDRTEPLPDRAIDGGRSSSPLLVDQPGSERADGGRFVTLEVGHGMSRDQAETMIARQLDTIFGIRTRSGVDGTIGDRRDLGTGEPISLRRSSTGFDVSMLTPEDRAALVAELAPDMIALADRGRRFTGGRIAVSSALKHRRAGFAFGPTPLEFEAGQLTAAQLEQIEADPLLTVKALGGRF